MLYEGFYSYEEVVIKNATEKAMMDTGQYYDTYNMDLDRTASRSYYVRLDSRATSKVNGVNMLVVYNLVRETKIGYYRRKDKWVQSMFEDHDHRMVTTMTLIVKSDYISMDHRGKELFYGSKFKDKYVEKYQVGHCRIDYIAVDPGG